MNKLPEFNTKSDEELSVEQLSVEEVASIVDKQPRLQEFVRCLYQDEVYRVSKLKSLDSTNFLIAQSIVKDIYPEHWRLFSKHF